MFSSTSRITFELSNLCNMNHKECPVSQYKEKHILPGKIVYDILEICRVNNYNGMICFHRYNEPTIDPRLMLFIKTASGACRKIMLMTNGLYFNDELQSEFYEAGVTDFIINKYPSKNFDDRLHMMERPDQGCKVPCYAPLNDIIITADGRVGLCCYDWENRHTFGSASDLKNILISDEFNEAYKRLSSGDRYLDLCKKCKAVR